MDHSNPKSIGKTGRTKSAAYLEALGNNGHSFSKRTFHRPTYCQHCTDLLWGFTNQGVQCSVCNYVSHEKCLFYLRIPCLYLARSLVKNPVGHIWYSSAYLRRKFCNVCRKFMNDSSILCCKVCDYCAHVNCQDSAIPNCKKSATYSLNHKKGDHEHKWQEGNIPSGSKCCFCKKTCSSTECLTSMKCLWCNKTAHSGCFEQVSKKCDFGDFYRMILPPFVVSLPNLSIWRKMSNEAKKEVDTSDDVLLSEHIDSDDENLVVTSTDSVHRSDATNSIRIYDGKISSPKTFKVVHVSRTATAVKVLEEALRLYQIKDDPDNYYLTKTLDQVSERTVEAGEMPLQFPNRDSKPMLFLRIKNADKSGSIRVYLAIDSDKTSFKAIKVQATTTVNEVMKCTLEKIPAVDKKVEDHVLVMTTMHDGVTERVMEHDECPWKLLSDTKRRSVREMKLTRFYLRTKYEPCNDAVLCVSNLPTMLTTEVYHSFLREHLQNDDFNIEGLYPSSGTVFLSFSSSDKAASAMTDLENASLSGKTLFVKLLPNIHVDAVSEKVSPLLVLVNARSGGGQGIELLVAFQKLLNPHQVHSLSDGGPLPGLFSFRHLPSFRLLVCGGDGTVGWVLSALDECGKNLICSDPPVAIVPLGTGNDLSRVFRWGAGYSGNEDPLSLLLAVDNAETALLDRWLILFESADTVVSDECATSTQCIEDLPNSFVMNNYFGIGIDAALALDFHLAREEAPEKFTSRLHNKSVYFRVGLRNMVRKSLSFNENVELLINDVVIDLPTLEGIIILNISSWGAGCDVWGPGRDDKFAQASCRDNLLEVVGVTGVMHMGQVKSGIRCGIRLGQGAKINIKLKSELPVHIDGEPWYQTPGNIIIRPTSHQAKMLIKRRSKARSAVVKQVECPTTDRAVVSSKFYSFDETTTLTNSTEITK